MTAFSFLLLDFTLIILEIERLNNFIYFGNNYTTNKNIFFRNKFKKNKIIYLLFLSIILLTILFFFGNLI